MREEIHQLFALSRGSNSTTGWNAWHKLVPLLEEAQLHSCRVETGYAESSQRSAQVRRVTIGSVDLECTKPNGVRVYSAYRHLPQYPGLQRMEMTNYPPNGPTILIDRSTAQFPEIVQRFMYVRACEAFRQGFPLNPSNRSQYEMYGSYNCAAIRVLRKSANLNEQQFATILTHTKTKEVSSNVVVRAIGGQEIRLDQVLTNCFYSDANFKLEY
jgi:hypothetical protein